MGSSTSSTAAEEVQHPCFIPVENEWALKGYGKPDHVNRELKMKSLPGQKAAKSQAALGAGMGTGGSSRDTELNCVVLPHRVGAPRGDES